LRQTEGVDKVTVSFATQSAVVYGSAPIDRLIEALEDAGFEAFPIQERSPDLVISVKGMMCQKNCGATVANALKAIPGVLYAQADFVNAKAMIWGSTVASETAIDAIECVGFDASLLSRRDASAPSAAASEGASVKSSSSSGSSASDKTLVPKWRPSSTPGSLSLTVFAPEDLAHMEPRPWMILYVRNLTDNTKHIKRIEGMLEFIDGISRAHVDLPSKTVCLWGSADRTHMFYTLRDAGYDAVEYEGFLEAKEHSPTEEHGVKAKSAKKAATTYKEDTSDVMSTVTSSSGYMFIVNVKIGGMTCSSCSSAIESVLLKRKGIPSVRVALLAGKAQVAVDAAELLPSVGVSRSAAASETAGADCGEIVRDMIRDLGYTCEVISSRSTQSTDVDSGKTSHSLKLTFSVSGMSCANCAAKVERTLNGNPGVKSCVVSVMTNRAIVHLDEVVALSANPLGARDIIKIVEELGYGCQLLAVGDESAAGASKDTDEDVRAWSRLLAIALFFGVPLIMLHVLMYLSEDMMMWMDSPAACNGGITAGQVLMFFINTPLMVLVGYKFFRGAFLGALHWSFGMDLLITTGTSITYFYSLMQLYLACESGNPTDHVFLEVSGMLLFFVTIGKFIEAYARRHTASAISDLLKLQPTTAMLVEIAEEGNSLTAFEEAGQHPSNSVITTNGDRTINLLALGTGYENVTTIDVNLVQKGDILKVLPGSRMPTDGIIISGMTYVDESMITGESIPVLKKPGDQVFGSTVNQGGSSKSTKSSNNSSSTGIGVAGPSAVYIQATSVGSDSALSQIARLVEDAQMNRAPIQAYADKIAGYFTPAVLMLSLLTFVVWYSLARSGVVPRSWFEAEYGDPFLFSLLFAISVVVVSCPCALGLATPTAIMVGTSVGALNGVLIKGGVAFEMAHRYSGYIFCI
jgi:Cu+-exporting ATPase